MGSHGTRSRYVGGCRCDECRRALGAKTLVTAEPATVIVRRLVKAGLPIAEMARVTGIDRQALDALAHGRREQVTARTLGLLVKHRAELEARAPRFIGKWRMG